MKKQLYTIILIVILTISGSCTDEWLKPNQPSALSPENTYTTYSGLSGLVNQLCLGLRPEVIGRGTNMRRAYEGSDLAVLVNGSPRDYDSEMTPSAAWPNDFWNSAFKQVSYATVVISRADGITDVTQQKKDELKATGYFFLGYWYYRLINTFGDIPLILEETNYPKLDFKTSSKDRIIRHIIPLLEFAVEKLPLRVSSGQVNRAAGYMLLTKYYLMDGQFDKAVNTSSAVINYPGLKLMTSRFGALLNTTNPKIPNPNVMTDLFYKYNPSDPANTEQILVVQDYPIINGSTSSGSERMRESLVEWYTNNLDNNKGVSNNGTGSGNIAVVDGGTGGSGPLGASVGLQILWTGRGIGAQKRTWYFHNDIWADPAFKNDMRHTAPNYYPMEYLLYNRPGTNVYGKNLIKANCRDTLRSWDDIAYNKQVVDDENRLATNYNLMGGSMNWYIYRLAEAYLMRAEALVWLNRGAEAKDDINVIRNRAGAGNLNSSATLDDVLDERARELYWEEMRKTELVRISYTMAKLNLNGYSIDKLGTDNWFYDRMKKKNNIYFDVITHQKREFSYNGRIYRLSPYHIYWPIPESAINDNTMAHINQNFGYVGYENNVVPEND